MLLVDRPVVVPFVPRSNRTPLERLAAAFWSSADWRRRGARWLEQLAAVRKLDADLGDALEDCAIEAIADALAFGR